jgi:nucleotide-binding universal stress UspA family protein
MKILMPVDGSDYTKRMLGYVAAQGEWLGTGHDLLFLTVVAAIPAYAAGFLDRATLDGHYAEQAQKVLGPVCDFARQQLWHFDAVHRHGMAADAIADCAAVEKVGLIVMGSHGHGALVNVLLGSVATGVLARCTTPVLLVR